MRRVPSLHNACFVRSTCSTKPAPVPLTRFVSRRSLLSISTPCAAASFGCGQGKRVKTPRGPATVIGESLVQTTGETREGGQRRSSHQPGYLPVVATPKLLFEA